MGTDWDELAGWWIDEVAGDPAYAEQVQPLLLDLLDPQPGHLYLDAGCGDGRVMQAVSHTGAAVIGCDVTPELLTKARRKGPVVACRLPNLAWARPASFDGAYASLVLEHVAELDEFFSSLAGAVAPGGRLVVVVNHPLFTTPDSGPVVDPTDGEVYWRWGLYLENGSTEEPAAGNTVTFYHRPLATLVNAAAAAGWTLDRMIERGAPSTTEDPLLQAQTHIPRLLGCRWIRERPARR